MSSEALALVVTPDTAAEQANQCFDRIALWLPDEFKGREVVGVTQDVVEVVGIGYLKSMYWQRRRQAFDEPDERFVSLGLTIEHENARVPLTRDYVLRDYSIHKPYGVLRQVEPVTAADMAQAPLDLETVTHALHEIHNAFVQKYPDLGIVR